MHRAPSPAVVGAVGLVGAAGLAVGAGFVTSQGAPADQVSDISATEVALVNPAVDSALSSRLTDTGSSIDEGEPESRSMTRSVSAPASLATQRRTKHSLLLVTRQDSSKAVVHKVVATDPRDIAMGMLSNYGWSSDQFSCLDAIYERESGWNVTAENPYSGAYGLGQALPGSKMAAYGSDWATNAVTQLKWGFAYIKERYGSPCGAWGFWEGHGWY